MSRVARGLSLVAGGAVSARSEPAHHRLPSGLGERWFLPAPPSPTLSELFAASPRDGGWAARPDWAKARKSAGETPGEHLEALPGGRREVVRVNRAGGPGERGSLQLHAPKMVFFRYRNNKVLESGVLFQEPVDFLHHSPRRPVRHCERHVGTIDFDRFVALPLKAVGRSRRDDAVLA